MLLVLTEASAVPEKASCRERPAQVEGKYPGIRQKLVVYRGERGLGDLCELRRPIGCI